MPPHYPSAVRFFFSRVISHDAHYVLPALSEKFRGHAKLFFCLEVPKRFWFCTSHSSSLFATDNHLQLLSQLKFPHSHGGSQLCGSNTALLQAEQNQANLTIPENHYEASDSPANSKTELISRPDQVMD